MALRETAVAVVRRLQEAGFEAYWVGGCVRDVLLGRDPGDYDIATSAKPPEIEQLFPRTLAIGKQFGVILVLEGGFEFEVATFRADAEYEDGRHPSRVTFASAMEDARRRDFTVNGLFYDPVTDRTFDWVEGQADLQAKLIRTIGDPEERFREDHLRLLRAVRFAAQLGFGIEAETFAAIRRTGAQLAKVSAERIRDELIKLFQPPHAARGFQLLYESDLLRIVLPEMEATIGCEQSPEYHPEGTVFEHVRRMLELLPASAPPALPWAVLMHDIAKPVTASRDPETGAIHFYGHEKVGADMAEQIMQRLKFPRKEIEAVVQAVRCHMQFKDVPQMRKATVRRLILRPTFDLELDLHRLDCLGSHGSLDIYHLLKEQSQQLGEQPQLISPLLSGHNLIAFGLKPGPAMGALLTELRDKQLQEELRTPEDAWAWIRKRLEERPDLKKE